MKITIQQHNHWCVITTPMLSLVIDRQVRLGRMRFVGVHLQLSLFTWYGEIGIFNKTHELPR